MLEARKVKRLSRNGVGFWCNSSFRSANRPI
nr:MAG TPA: hypothetical protein [Caudoviricetes sp.]